MSAFLLWLNLLYLLGIWSFICEQVKFHKFISYNSFHFWRYSYSLLKHLLIQWSCFELPSILKFSQNLVFCWNCTVLKLMSLLCLQRRRLRFSEFMWTYTTATLSINVDNSLAIGRLILKRLISLIEESLFLFVWISLATKGFLSEKRINSRF